jgi:hypothetical protein
VSELKNYSSRLMSDPFCYFFKVPSVPIVQNYFQKKNIDINSIKEYYVNRSKTLCTLKENTMGKPSKVYCTIFMPSFLNNLIPKESHCNRFLTLLMYYRCIRRWPHFLQAWLSYFVREMILLAEQICRITL